MKFGEKLRMLRKEKKLLQDDMAKALGVTRKTYLSYETNGKYPRKRETYQKLADILECDVDYLLTEKEEFVVEAAENYGYNGMHQAAELVAELSVMFAGGSLSDADKDAVFHALEKAYYMCKEDNKKYTPKKYIKNDENPS